MSLPARIREVPTRPDKRLRSPSHLAWVRSHACIVPGCQSRPIQAMHVRSGTDGGMGMKPGDDWTASGCFEHHHEQHQIGERAFQEKYKIDLIALAREFAARSPKLKNRRRA